jgi:hypothetical protein
MMKLVNGLLNYFFLYVKDCDDDDEDDDEKILGARTLHAKGCPMNFSGFIRTLAPTQERT